MAKVHKLQNRILTLLVTLLVLMLGGLAVLQAGRMDIALFESDPTYHELLVDEIGFAGQVDVAQLGLSRKEVHTINRTVRRHGRTFDKVDMVLDRKDLFDKAPVSEQTKLDVQVVMHAGQGRVIQCWKQTIPRKRLVAHMVRSIRRAADEVKRLDEINDCRKGFRRMYI